MFQPQPQPQPPPQQQQQQQQYGKLKARVLQAAEAALARQHYVCAIDVLVGIRLLEPSHVDYWKQGRTGFLEQSIQANPGKVSLSLATFHQWARAKNLLATETPYIRNLRGAATVDLRFTSSGDAALEKAYRTHYVAPALPERKQRQIVEKAARAPQPVVFQNLRDSECTECGAAIPRDSFLFMEAGQPLCLPCAQLDGLEFLPAGDAALTRRASKYSGSGKQPPPVVVRFSRTRGRYERQGLLVESAALEKAELECAADAGERAAARARAAVQRDAQDRELVARMKEKLAALFPGCPPGDVSAIAKHTAVRGSGRVGRTAAGRSLDERALAAAVAAAVRHNHTGYDKLLASGVDRESARQRVADRVREILEAWRK